MTDTGTAPGDQPRMAIDPDGNVKPVSEFTAGERWWCEGEDCDGDYRDPHVHVADGCCGSVRMVDLETGRDVKPETAAEAKP